jgi:hypothetical protein
MGTTPSAGDSGTWNASHGGTSGKVVEKTTVG